MIAAASAIDRSAGVDPATKSLLTRLRLHVELSPDPGNRITLSDERDALGMRRVNLHWDLTELDRHSIERALELYSRALGSARRRVLIQTPYLVFSDPALELFDIIGREVTVKVHTNSLASTDNWAAYAHSTRQRFDVIKRLGLDVRELKLGDRTVHLELGRVSLEDGEGRSLSDLETRLLRYLAVNRGRPVDRKELLQRVWGGGAHEMETRAVERRSRSVR